MEECDGPNEGKAGDGECKKVIEAEARQTMSETEWARNRVGKVREAAEVN